MKAKHAQAKAQRLETVQNIFKGKYLPKIPTLRIGYKAPQNLAEAKSIIRELGRNMAEHAFLIGRHLRWVKEQLAHSEFIPWVEGNFWFSVRTAQRMMAFSEQCDDAGRLLEYEPRKSDTVTYLTKDRPSGVVTAHL
jgi:hypothetical protein